MNHGYYRFKLGEFQCVSLCDGQVNYPVESFVTNVPKAQVEKILRERGLSTAHIASPYTLLYVDTGEHRVMIDTGAGEMMAGFRHAFPGVDNAASFTGALRGSMAAAGVAPADVDVVIITHAHPDHVGGTLGEDGQPIFANARYFIARREWEFWDSDAATAGIPEMFVGIARGNLRPVLDRLTLIEDGQEIVPGIRAIATYGHTPGHIAVAIASDGQQLLHISDAALSPLQLEHPEWAPIFDIDPARTADSKRRIFDQAAAEKALVFGHHFPPFPCLGHVVVQGEGWRWLPIA
jgi:glyoxylase-like metal-dependent hydrolase (beta-lactamase superfamily II)